MTRVYSSVLFKRHRKISLIAQNVYGPVGEVAVLETGQCQDRAGNRSIEDLCMPNRLWKGSWSGSLDDLVLLEEARLESAGLAPVPSTDWLSTNRRTSRSLQICRHSGHAHRTHQLSRVILHNAGDFPIGNFAEPLDRHNRRLSALAPLAAALLRPGFAGLLTRHMPKETYLADAIVMWHVPGILLVGSGLGQIDTGTIQGVISEARLECRKRAFARRAWERMLSEARSGDEGRILRTLAQFGTSTASNIPIENVYNEVSTGI